MFLTLIRFINVSDSLKKEMPDTRGDSLPDLFGRNGMRSWPDVEGM